MKKILFYLLAILIVSCKTSTKTPSGDLLVTTLNTVIQSDAVQTAQFSFADGCDSSTLNNMIFCDAAEVSGDITISTIDQGCVDAAKAIQDTENAAIDDTRKICKTGCEAVDWTCGGCCSDGCQDASDLAKEGTQAEYDASVELCGYLDIPIGSYLYQIETIKGVGALNVVSVTNPVVGEDSNVFSVDIAMNIPTEVLAHTYYDTVGIKGHIDLSTSGATAAATGSLTDVCGDGYYLQLDTLVITIPENIFDSNLLTEIAEELGIAVSDLTGGIVDLNALILSELNDVASTETMKAINSALSDIKIADSDCE